MVWDLLGEAEPVGLWILCARSEDDGFQEFWGPV